MTGPRTQASQREFLRTSAARLAVELFCGQQPTEQQIRLWMDFFYGWITAPPTAALRATLVIRDAEGKPTATFTSTDGGTMSTAMTMDDTVTVSISTEDDHGDATSDTLSAITSDNGSVVTWAQNGGVWTGTPVAEGESVLTVTDPAAPTVAAFVADVTVGPGATSQIQGSIVVNTGANKVPAAG